MKTPTPRWLSTPLLLLILLTGGPLAQAYYDPGIQRWINRDPIGDAAFRISPAGKSKLRSQLELNTYGFLENVVMNRIDPDGLKVWYCTRRTDWGVGRHGYLWDDRTPIAPKYQFCGQESVASSGPTTSPTDTYPGGNDGDVTCQEIPDSEGHENAIMSYCRDHANDQLLWWPGNDCHTAIETMLKKLKFNMPPVQRWNLFEQKFVYYMRTGIHPW